MPRLSIIVPVFNAEAYLGECLDSLAGQAFGDIEILCVNDGSTDSSRHILAARSQSDERIRIIDRANGGPSAARNTGIRAASGEFIVFLDSDDLLDANACAAIDAAFDARTETVVFGWSCFGGTANRWMLSRGDVPDAFFPTFTPDLLFDQPVQPFLRLAVRRAALERQGILFDDSLRISEDAAFLFAVFPRVSGVRLISDKLYRYRLPHEGSIMREIADDDVAECLHYLNAMISIFADWARGGFLCRYGADLVSWSVKYALYTMLRQKPDIRRELAGALGDLWRVYWTEDELRSLAVPRHAKLLMAHALDVDAPHLARDLASYRIAEYGIADVAATAAERIAQAKAR